MGSMLKRIKKREWLTEEEVQAINKDILKLKEESENICKKKDINKQDFERLCEIGRTMQVYKKKLKKSLKYSS